MSDSKPLSSKTVFITGGTSELGHLLVQEALRQGASVFFTYFSGTDRAAQLSNQGAIGLQADFADMRSIDACVASFKEKTHGLDILIHNAAAVRDHTLANLSEADWDYVMTVDLKAPYYLTKKLLPYFIKKPKTGTEAIATKKIFFITSRVAVSGGFGISNYAAAKAGLIGLTKSLAQELGKRKVLVNAVNPGFMKSRMTCDLPEAVIENNLEASPLHQFSDPAEVARLLIDFCSDRMTQITGQVLHFESRKI